MFWAVNYLSDCISIIVRNGLEETVEGLCWCIVV